MNKPWGTETLLTAPDSPYCMKVLEVRRGERLSLQSHTEKHETLYLAKGEALLTLDKDSRLMLEGETVVVPPMTPHRVAALTRCVIYEASTPETGTTIRHEDDYGRGNASYD